MKTYKLKIWETEDDRNSGFSDILKSNIESLTDAIKEAKLQFDKQDLECVVVLDDKEETTYFLKDHSEEKMYNEAIFELFEEKQMQERASNLSKEISIWYEGVDPYGFRDDFDSLEEAISTTFEALYKDPLAIYDNLRLNLLEFEEAGEDFQTGKKIQDELINFVIEDFTNKYSLEKLNEKSISDFLKLGNPDFENENILSDYYLKASEELKINNIRFIDVKMNQNYEYDVNVEFTSGGTLKTSVENFSDDKQIIASIKEIKEQAVIDAELQEILNYEREPKEISVTERKEILNGFKRSICNYKLTELPLNRQEAKSNYERKLYEKLQYTSDIIKIDFKAVDKEVNNFFEKNNIAENFNTLGDIAKINESFEVTNELTNSQET